MFSMAENFIVPIFMRFGGVEIFMEFPGLSLMYEKKTIIYSGNTYK